MRRGTASAMGGAFLALMFAPFLIAYFVFQCLRALWIILEPLARWALRPYLNKRAAKHAESYARSVRALNSIPLSPAAARGKAYVDAHAAAVRAAKERHCTCE